MPDFTVTDQSGKKYRIPGPEGATQEQAQQEFNKQQGIRSQAPQAKPDTGLLGRAEAFQQGAILDPVEKLAQMGTKALGYDPAQVAGQVLPDWLQQTLERSRRTAETYPIERTVGNIAPWLLIPGGEGVVGDMLLGTAGGLLQPTDPKNPNYWRDVGYGGAFGGLAGSSLGMAARGIAGSRAAAKASELAQTLWDALREGTPGRATRTVYQHIANLVNDPSIFSGEITPRTAAEVQGKVGDKLTAIYKQMSFDPNTPGWLSNAQATRDRISNLITDPKIRDRWNQVFTDDAIRPAFGGEAGARPGTVGTYGAPPPPPVTSIGGTTMRPPTVGTRPGMPMGARSGPLAGDKLNQLMSKLSAEQNDFGLMAQQGGPDAKTYRLMAQGLKDIRKSIGTIIDAPNPALGAARRAANEAYSLTDFMVKGTSATKGGVESPAGLIGTLQKKVGKKAYGASDKFRDIKDMLEEERQTHEGLRTPPFRVPPTPSTAAAGARKVAGAVTPPTLHAMGIPAAVVHLGRAAGKGAERAAGRATIAAGRRPGAVGAVTGQVTPFAGRVTGLWHIIGADGRPTGAMTNTTDPRFTKLKPGERLEPAP